MPNLELLLPYALPLVLSYASYLFGKRKSNAETDKIKIESEKGILEAIKDFGLNASTAEMKYQHSEEIDKAKELIETIKTFANKYEEPLPEKPQPVNS